MKKHTFTILLIILAFLPGRAQVQLHDSGNHGLMRISVKESDRMNDVKGSPYLNESFQAGTAKVKDKEPLNVFLRFNVAQDQIEIKLDSRSEEVYLLPRNGNSIYEIGDQTIVFDEFVSEGNRISGYFIEHFDGDQFRLLEKPVATLTEAVKAKTGYDKDRPAEINIEEEFFILTEDGKAQNVRIKQKDLKKAFDSEGARKYLGDNKIRSVQDLKAFVAFLDKQ